MEDFLVTIGMSQSSTLSPYLFILILDVLTKHTQELTLRCMFFIDDIILLEEYKKDLNERLKTWRLALKKWHSFK